MKPPVIAALFAFGLVACESSTPIVSTQPQPPATKTIQIISDSPGVRIEVNDDYVGDAPVSITVPTDRAKFTKVTSFGRLRRSKANTCNRNISTQHRKSRRGFSSVWAWAMLYNLPPPGPEFQSRPERVTCTFAMRHFHEPAGSSDTNDPAQWDRASYFAHPIDSIEPIDLAPNGYRSAALAYLKLMWTVDEYLAAAADARFAVIVVAIVLGWPSTRG